MTKLRSKINCNVIVTGKFTGSNLDEDPNRGKRYRWLVPLGLIISLLILFLYIEYKHPYFFLQDDNRDYYLPYFIYNYKSLLNGELAVYNFHQFLGIPSLAVGQSGTLYPITYLSVFASDLIFGHYFAAVDIQVILQLLIGGVGFYKLIRFFDVERKVAFFAGISWPLSSFIVYVSNSWVIVSAVAAYFPWMLFLSFRLFKEATPKATIYAIIPRLLLFYAGHIQYFIYSIIFEFITVILYTVLHPEASQKKARILKFIKEYLKGYIYVFVLSLPLLLPMWHQTNISSSRSGRLQFSTFVSQYFPFDQLLKGLFYPFLDVNENTYASFRNMLNLSHIGYIPIFLIVIGIVDRYIIRKNNIKVNTVRLFVFIGPALLAFFWATNWVFNYIIYLIPILNRFRWPFKLAFYLDFYLIIIAALILSYITKHLFKRKTAKRIILLVITILQVVNFGFLYTCFPYKDFGEHHSDTIPLEEKLKDKLKEGRIISVGFDTWTPTTENNQVYLTAPTLGFDYATLWGLDYFAGYEPLIPAANAKACLDLNFSAIIDYGDPIPIDYLRKAAVKWYIVPRDRIDEYSKIFIDYGIIPLYEDENRVVFYDENANSMFFNSDGEKIKSNYYKVTANKIEISVDMQQSDKVILNYLYNPFFKAYIDGKKTELISEDIQMAVSVPVGKHRVLIKYEDPYLITGAYIAIAFLITLATIYTLVHMRKKHNRNEI